MFEHIVVPLDGSKLSESILDYVVPMAKSLNSKVVLLHAVSDQYADTFAGVSSVREGVARLRRSAVDVAGGYLAGVSERLAADGAQVEVDSEYGSPAAVILKYIEERKPDLVAMSTNGRSGLQRMIVGSVTGAILPHSDVPMLVIHPREGDKRAFSGLPKNVVIPLDMSEQSESVLPLAIGLSKRLNLNVGIVTCVPEPAQMYGGPMPSMHSYPDDLMAQADAAASGYLEDTAQLIRDEYEYDADVAWAALRGNARNAIVKHVEDTEDSLIAMSTNGRTGVGRWVLGSVTEAIVRSSGNPVLIVRPKSDD